MTPPTEPAPAPAPESSDEPVFVLRAQDCFAPEVVELWALTARMRGASQTKTEEARAVATAMREWQAVHGSKIPD